MSIAVIITDRNTDQLCQVLKEQLPDIHIQQWPDISQPETVELAVLWDHPPGITNEFPNLKTLLSMGAGMDHIDNDSEIVAHIKRDRIVTLALQQNMAQYVLQHILADYRHAITYQQQQSTQVWKLHEDDTPPPVIGFLGLGALGGFVADRCADFGFETIAWTQQQKHPLHTCYHGRDGLEKVCQSTDYLVVLLPLTQETQEIINRKTLSWCSRRMMLINVARGGHVNETDLLQALDAQEIRHAVLDVFQNEPLPHDHPFWSHPKITLTPHSSARSDIRQTAQAIARTYLSSKNS